MTKRLMIPRFSIHEPNACEGVAGNVDIYIDGQHVRDVQMADMKRGVVRMVVKGSDGAEIVDRKHSLLRTTEQKGRVEIVIRDPALYVRMQRELLHEIEAEYVKGEPRLDHRDSMFRTPERFHPSDNYGH